MVVGMKVVYSRANACRIYTIASSVLTVSLLTNLHAREAAREVAHRRAMHHDRRPTPPEAFRVPRGCLGQHSTTRLGFTENKARLKI